MAGYLTEWLELLLRWFHVVAGIAWIGESFYFVMLDRSLRPSKSADVAGELWSVHGGGFYHAQKYQVAPGVLPAHLHWSKWKSYATWLSGFTLFAALYLLQPTLYLVDPAVLPLSPAAADGIACLFLVAGWFTYDTMCHRLGSSETRLAMAVGCYVLLTAYLATHIFAGRAAFLIEGATLATIMSANVFFVIIPGQRRMVDALRRDETPDPRPGQLGRQRSVHNTYFTLPVVFSMISNHYAMTYSAAGSWAVLCLIMAAGALTRQFFVLWHSGFRHWALPAGSAACIAAAMIWLKPVTSQAGGTASVTTFASIAPIIAQRCAPCHAAHPTLMASAPAGVMLDTPERILANAPRIMQQAVTLRAMPLGNVTHITEDERTLIGRWFADGAPS
jgi:uncharacterized membrane protein